jgi:hypothetical protein
LNVLSTLFGLLFLLQFLLLLLHLPDGHALAFLEELKFLQDDLAVTGFFRELIIIEGLWDNAAMLVSLLPRLELERTMEELNHVHHETLVLAVGPRNAQIMLDQLTVLSQLFVQTHSNLMREVVEYCLHLFSLEHQVDPFDLVVEEASRDVGEFVIQAVQSLYVHELSHLLPQLEFAYALLLHELSQVFALIIGEELVVIEAKVCYRLL